MIKVKKQKQARISQGDIFRDIDFIEYVSEKSGIIEVSKIVFPIVIVLTQDCDLKLDYKFRWSRQPVATQDKWLISVLVAPLYNVEHVYEGEHLSELTMKMEKINRKKSPGNYLRKNEVPRYHYLEFPQDVDIVSSVVDFKHYFSTNVNYLKKIKKTNFVCQVSQLYREEISHRFASYLSRIGLPEISVY